MAPFGTIPFGGGPFGSGPLGTPGPVGGVADGYTLRIGPQTDAINYLFYNSYRLKETLNGRNTCSFKLVVQDGFLPVRGQEVHLALGSLTLFRGKVWQRKVRYLSLNTDTGWLTVDVECVDWNALADQRLIGEVYENESLDDIVRDIVSKTLFQEGVSDDGVRSGPIIAKAVFPNIPVAQAFDQLSEQTGYYWDIDYNKVLQFGPRNLALAPFDLTVGLNSILLDFEDSETLSQYRNLQLIEGGKGITAVRTERLPGDGETRTWNVEYPIYAKPSIDIDGVPVDPNMVGIRGLDEGKRFYWNKGESAIGQDKDDTVIPSTDTIGITYQGLYDLLTEVIDPVGIADRQSVEGGTGLYEKLFSSNSLDGEDVTQQKGLGLIKKFSLGSDASVVTDTSGLSPWQQVKLTCSDMGITDRWYLVTEVESFPLVRTTRRTKAKITTGEYRGGFEEFWKRTLRHNPITIRDQVLQTVVRLVEENTVSDADTVTLQVHTADEWGTSIEGESEWGEA